MHNHAFNPSRARTRRAAAALALTAVLGVAISACGDDDSQDPAATRTATNGDVFNEADVRFASDMIQHHAQALAMVDLTVGRPLDAEVQDLADAIRDAQGPEIETMADWLTIASTPRGQGPSGQDASSPRIPWPRSRARRARAMRRHALPFAVIHARYASRKPRRCSRVLSLASLPWASNSLSAPPR